jgi:hypothetical protein
MQCAAHIHPLIAPCPGIMVHSMGFSGIYFEFYSLQFYNKALLFLSLWYNGNSPADNSSANKLSADNSSNTIKATTCPPTTCPPTSRPPYNSPNTNLSALQLVCPTTRPTTRPTIFDYNLCAFWLQFTCIFATIYVHFGYNLCMFFIIYNFWLQFTCVLATIYVRFGYNLPMRILYFFSTIYVHFGYKRGRLFYIFCMYFRAIWPDLT